MDDIWRAVAAGAALGMLGAVLGLGWLWLGRCMDRAFFGARGGSVPDPGPVPDGFAVPVAVPDGYEHAGTVALSRYVRACSDGDRDLDAGTVRADGGAAGSVAVAAGAVGSGSAAAAQRGVTDQRMGPGVTS